MAEAYEPLWTSEEAREYLGLKNINALNRLVRAQGLPFYPLNSKERRYRQSEIEAWLATRRTQKQSTEPVPGTQKPTKPKPAVRRGKHRDKIIAQISPHQQ